MAETKDTPERKHRATCASRLVVFSDEAPDGVSCGLPCDCDNPQPWVEVPIAPTPEPGPVRIDLPKPKVQGFDKMFQRIENEIVRPTPEPSVTTDPWESVREAMTFYGGSGLLAVFERTLALERQQHRDFKDAVARALLVENEDGPVSEAAIVAMADATMTQLLADSQQHRDALATQAQEIADLKADYAAAIDRRADCLLESHKAAEAELAQVRSRLTAVEQAMATLKPCPFAPGRCGKCCRCVIAAALTPTSPQTPEDRI